MEGGQILPEGAQPLREFRHEDLRYVCIVPPDQWKAQIQENLAREVTRFSPSLFVHDGVMVIVGAGLSAADHVEEIREEKAKGRPIVAVKGMHDWLIERGIIPNAWVCLDPQERILDCVKLKRREVCYMLATQGHPKLFDWLSDCQVVMWHAWTPGEEKEAVPDSMWVGGGSSSGLRAITLGYLQGFRRFILFGFDSCIAADGTKRLDGAKAADRTFYVRAGKDGKDRLCNGAMAAQAGEFHKNFDFMPGIQIKAIGDGLIADILAERKRHGFNDWRE